MPQPSDRIGIASTREAEPARGAGPTGGAESSSVAGRVGAAPSPTPGNARDSVPTAGRGQPPAASDPAPTSFAFLLAPRHSPYALLR